MTEQKIYEYLERIGNLLRAESRQVEGDGRIQSVQLEILHYLSICNRHSNMPAAVAEYMGLTKGTVSQTLRVLENRGYLGRTPDPVDKRVVHLHLTAKGRALVATATPPAVLRAGLARMPPAQRQQLTQALESLLKSIQSGHRLRTFGVCRTCRHLQTTGQGHRCGLTGLPLAVAELELICREHLAPDP